MQTVAITFSGKTEMPNVWPNNMDYVENCASIIDAIAVLAKYYTASDMQLITKIEIINN